MATAPNTLAPVGLCTQHRSDDLRSRGRETEVIAVSALTAEGLLAPQLRGGKMTDGALSTASTLDRPSEDSILGIGKSPEWHSLRVFGRGRGRVYFEAGDVGLKTNGGYAVWRDGFDAYTGGWPS
jgi:hypothetical protein